MASDSMRWNYISRIWWSMVVITSQIKSLALVILIWVITSQTKLLAMVILIWVTVSTLEAQVYPKADMASPNMIVALCRRLIWHLRTWRWPWVDISWISMVHERWGTYDITYVQRMFVEVCLTKKWSIGHLWCGQRLQTEEVKTLSKGHGVIESTHKRYGFIGWSMKCHLSRNAQWPVMSFSDVIPYISRC